MAEELFELPGGPPPSICRAMRKNIAVPLLAMCTLLREASRSLRGDGVPADTALLLDAIPVFVELGVSPAALREFHTLAVMVADGYLPAPPADDAAGWKNVTLVRIARAAMAKRHEFAAALRAAADAVESFEWNPTEND
jgi:hypothetical protein